MMEMTAYSLCGYENGLYMFDAGSDSRKRCEKCGFILDNEELGEHFRFEGAYRPYYIDFDVTDLSPISATFDRYLVVSSKFRCVAIEGGGMAEDFIAMKNDSDHYGISPRKVIQYNTVASGTRFEDLCSKCENYKTVIRPGNMLRISETLEEGLYRSQHSYGSDDGKKPQIVVTPKLKLLLDQAFSKDKDLMVFEPLYREVAG